MALNVDEVLDRRQMRRKLSFWRISSLVLLTATIIAVLAASGSFEALTKRSDHIARVAISGAILEDRKLLELFDKIKEDDDVLKMLDAVEEICCAYNSIVDQNWSAVHLLHSMMNMQMQSYETLAGSVQKSAEISKRMGYPRAKTKRSQPYKQS